MNYTKTPVKNNIKGATDSELVRLLDRKGTGYIVFYLLKRHKTALLSLWAVLITVLYLYPPFTDHVKDILRAIF